MQAVAKYSPEQWRGQMVVMRDVVQSSWNPAKKNKSVFIFSFCC
jgi:hypothetical protein